ncbi:energy transducer TonB [Cetobacterium ceti]
MNKFYIIAIIIHLIVGYNFLKPQRINLVPKRGGTVQVNFFKSGTNTPSGEKISLTEKNNIEKNNIEEKEKKEEKQEQKKEVKSKLKKKKIIKSKIKKEKNNVPNKIINKDFKSVKENKKVGLEGDDRFTKGKDGIYVASSSEGIEFEFLNIVNPNYPIIAKKLRYSGKAIVQTKFLVDLNGNVKDIEILGGINKLGFREECIRALSQWKFKPIVYKGEHIKVYFYKEFKFTVNS